MSEESWASRHRVLVVVAMVVLLFIGFKTGIVDKGDARILVHEGAAIVKEFKDFIVSLFH